jgi:hypothetical protein
MDTFRNAPHWRLSTACDNSLQWSTRMGSKQSPRQLSRPADLGPKPSFTLQTIMLLLRSPR